jgi:type II secretory ATPase GspE/PulE/Tfp pilus assembly ATPase PilB-like protein
MAQAKISRRKTLMDSSCQTGNEHENIYKLTVKKKIKLYYSNVYKQNVYQNQKVLFLLKAFGKNFVNSFQQLKNFSKMLTTTFNDFHTFVHPFTALVAGPTGSEKTQFVVELLKCRNKAFNMISKRIIYCYSI